MAGMRAISAGGRALLVAGAAVLLGSLFVLPWFEVSGARPDLPAGGDWALPSSGGALVGPARGMPGTRCRRLPSGKRHSPALGVALAHAFSGAPTGWGRLRSPASRGRPSAPAVMR